MLSATPPIAGAPNPTDTALYRTLLQTPASDLRTALTAKFRAHEFLVVRGFLTDALDRLGVMMADQIRAVRDLGCEARKPGPPFDSEAAPAVNASAIARAVDSARSPVILLTHSKGSVDALAALVSAPAIRDRVAGWVSLQGAIQGSPVADFVAGTGNGEGGFGEALRRAALTAIFERVFGGSLASLHALRTRDRVEYLQRNAGDVHAVLSRIPAVAFGSAAPRRRSMLRVATDWLFRNEPRNDGLVSVERSVIPGARIVHDLDGPDHGDAVTHVPGQGWDRIALTYALLSML
jgi:hypothetical protein